MQLRNKSVAFAVSVDFNIYIIIPHPKVMDGCCSHNYHLPCTLNIRTNNVTCLGDKPQGLTGAPMSLFIKAPNKHVFYADQQLPASPLHNCPAVFTLKKLNSYKFRPLPLHQPPRKASIFMTAKVLAKRLEESQDSLLKLLAWRIFYPFF